MTTRGWSAMVKRLPRVLMAIWAGACASSSGGVTVDAASPPRLDEASAGVDAQAIDLDDSGPIDAANPTPASFDSAPRVLHPAADAATDLASPADQLDAGAPLDAPVVDAPPRVVDAPSLDLPPDRGPDQGANRALDRSLPPDGTSCAGVCVCPPPIGGALFVDPVEGNDDPGAVPPTGAATPAACRFRTITHALAIPGVNRVVVGTANPPVTLDGEPAPLSIPAGVAVTSEDATPIAGRYLLSFSGAITTAVTLGPGATLAGIDVALPASAATSTAIACRTGTAALRGVSVRGARAGRGIAVGETARCTLTLDDVTVSGFGSGVVVQAGGLVARGLVATGNAQCGLQVQAGALASVTVGAGSRFDGNDVDGIRFERGTFVGTGLQAVHNTVNGISLRGGAMTLHQSKVSGNGDLGVRMIGAQLTIDDGSQLDDNGASGVKIEGGSLVVGGVLGAPVELSRNGALNDLYGVNIDAPGAGTSVAITRAVMKGNAGYGIKVLFQSPGGSVTVTDTELAENRLGGLFIRQAESSGVSPPVLIDRVRIHDNGVGGQTGFGINLAANNGSVTTVVRNSVIRDNGDAGIWIDQPAGNTTVFSLDGSEIDGNNRTAGRSAGGIIFVAPSTLARFSGNKIHDNAGDQVAMSTAPNGGGGWTLRGAVGCGADTNQIYCYGPGRVGVRAASGVAIDAQSVSWQNPVPTAGTDFAGNVLAGAPCAPVAALCR